MAQQERAFIREQIAAGKDKAQIKAALVDEYGEEILAQPEANGFNAALWIVPIVLVAARRGRDRRRDPALARATPATTRSRRSCRPS